MQKTQLFWLSTAIKQTLTMLSHLLVKQQPFNYFTLFCIFTMPRTILPVLLGVHNETAVRWQMGFTYLRPWWKWLKVYAQLKHWTSISMAWLLSFSLSCSFSFFLILLPPVIASRFVHTRSLQQGSQTFEMAVQGS